MSLFISPQLAGMKDVNEYTTIGASNKDALHTLGRKFLKELVSEVGIPAGTYDIRSNKGGMAVSGEVTLHSERLYVQLYENGNGVEILFRTVRGLQDYSGGQNNFAGVAFLFTHAFERERFVEKLKALGGY